MVETILGVERLGRRIGDRWLWRGLSFVLRHGDKLGLVGPSGTGKTTLMRAIAGLDPVDEGQVSLQGRPLDEWVPSAYRAKVMYLHQRPALLSGTVADNFRRPFQLKAHHEQRFNESRAREYLEALGRAPGMLDQDTSNLSGGEGQIVALIRALLLDPDILLLDEPTASLDPATTGRVEALIDRWLTADAPRACMWTSHDAAQLDRVATRRLNMNEGTHEQRSHQ